MDPDQAQFHAGRPTWELESDNDSDDEGYGEDPTGNYEEQQQQRSTKPLASEPVVSLSNSTAIAKRQEVVFLLGEAGEALSPLVKIEGEVNNVLVDGVQVGIITTSSSSPTLVFLDASIPYAHQHPLSTFLLSTLSPSSLTILTTYHLASYIPTTTDFSPCPLYLSTTSSTSLPPHIQPFTPPNLHHGLSASLLTQSLLLSPTAPIPALLLLVPTQTPAHFAALNRPTEGSDVVREVRHLAAALGWNWVGSAGGGGGAGKGMDWLEKKRREKRREEAGSMYM